MRKVGRCANSNGILFAWGGIVPLRRASLCICAEALPPNGARNNGTQAEIGKTPLTAGGRRACNELGMPVADSRARLKNRRRSLNLHQHHHGNRNRDGRRRVHHDAQRAVVGIALQRMHVRHLHHGQQRHQEKAHHRRRRQCAWLSTARSADLCLQSCQPTTLVLRITKLYAIAPAVGPRCASRQARQPPL